MTLDPLPKRMADLCAKPSVHALPDPAFFDLAQDEVAKTPLQPKDGHYALVEELKEGSRVLATALVPRGYGGPAAAEAAGRVVAMALVDRQSADVLAAIVRSVKLFVRLAEIVKPQRRPTQFDRAWVNGLSSVVN